jgi:hypothetical protein
MSDQQMVAEGYLQKVIVDDQRAGFYLEQLLAAFDAVEGDGSFVAVADAGVPVVVGKVFNYKLLAYIDDLVDVLARYVD